MTTECFLADSLDSSSKRVKLNVQQSHHLSNVARKKINDPVELIDGNGRIGFGFICSIEKNQVIVELDSMKKRDRQFPERHLVVAMPKSEQVFDTILKGATQLGVWHIWPICTERSRHLSPHQIDRRKSRWERIVSNACKQCRQPWFPIIHPPQNLVNFLNSDLKVEAVKMVGWEPDLGDQISSCVFIRKKTQCVYWMVGSEGGWTPSESQLILNTGFHPVQIGKLVLTTEIGCLAGLSIINHIYLC